MSGQCPFAILGISPTADPLAIKRAYFAALVRWPPHRDAEVFRLVRAAYEILSDPNARTLALMRAPVDADAELAAFDAAWTERLERVASQARAAQLGERAVEAFISRISKLTFADLRIERG